MIRLTFLASFVILLNIFLFLYTPLAFGRSGCCSWHGGVCGCGCCDGSPLSQTCAPYYPECNNSQNNYGYPVNQNSSGVVIPAAPYNPPIATPTPWVFNFPTITPYPTIDITYPTLTPTPEITQDTSDREYNTDANGFYDGSKITPIIFPTTEIIPSPTDIPSPTETPTPTASQYNNIDFSMMGGAMGIGLGAVVLKLLISIL